MRNIIFVSLQKSRQRVQKCRRYMMITETNCPDADKLTLRASLQVLFKNFIVKWALVCRDEKKIFKTNKL